MESGFSAPRGTCAGNLDDRDGAEISDVRVRKAKVSHKYLLTVASIFLAPKYFFKAARSRRPGDHVVRPAVPRAFRRENLLERESWAVKLYLCSAVHLSHSRTGCTQQQKKVHVYENKLKLIHKFSSTQQ